MKPLAPAKAEKIHPLVIAGSAVLIVVFFTVVMLSPTPPQKAAEAVPALTYEQNAALDAAVATGAVRIDAAQHEAWMDPEAWNALEFSRKESLAALIAARIDEQTGTRRVTIKDKLSGKKLATFSGAWGFSVE